MTDSTGKPWSSRSLMRCYDEASRVARTEEGEALPRPPAACGARWDCCEGAQSALALHW